MSTVTRQALQFGGSILLARVLDPTDYGLAAIAISVNAFAALFTDLGLKSALLHFQARSPSLLASAFWINTVTGLVVTATIASCSPLVSALYDEPALTTLLLIASANFTLSMHVVPMALMELDFRFRRISVLETTGAATALLVAVFAASTGAGAVSLVIGPVVATTIVSALAWKSVGRLSSWRPTVVDCRLLWSYASGVIGFMVVNYLARNFDNLALGKVTSAATLGLYSKSYSLMVMPVQQISGVLSRVLLPALSERTSDQRGLGDLWLKSVRIAWSIGTPIGLGLAVTAPYLVPFLFGDRWTEMVPTLQILCLSIPPQLIGRTLGTIFQSTGRTRLQFRIAGVTSAIGVAMIVSGATFGIRGVAIAVVCHMCFSALVTTTAAVRVINVNVSDVVRRLLPVAVSAAIMVVAVQPVALALRHAEHWIVLLAQVSIGFVTYTTALSVLDRDTTQLVRSALK